MLSLESCGNEKPACCPLGQAKSADLSAVVGGWHWRQRGGYRLPLQQQAARAGSVDLFHSHKGLWNYPAWRAACLPQGWGWGTSCLTLPVTRCSFKQGNWGKTSTQGIVGECLFLILLAFWFLHAVCRFYLLLTKVSPSVSSVLIFYYMDPFSCKMAFPAREPWQERQVVANCFLFLCWFLESLPRAVLATSWLK